MADTPCSADQTQRRGETAKRHMSPSDEERRAAPMDLLRPGDVVNERFEVLDRLGAGSLGTVYRVHDRTMGEDRALKALHPAMMAPDRARERFVTQVRIALRLAHPSVVRVHDYAEDPDRGIQYYTMEFVRGVSLDRYLRQHGSQLPLEEVLVLAERLAEALSQAHRIAIHRDLKPQNVMVTGENTVKVLDFGMAQVMTPVQFSQSAMVMGTAYYQAPEIHLHHQSIDHRADIYSFGVILYEMLTGRIPQGNFPLPSELVPGAPRSLNRIVTRCLATAVEDRFDSAEDLVEAIRDVSRGGKGPLSALVEAVRERTALLAPVWNLVRDADPDEQRENVHAAEIDNPLPPDRFAAPTAALVDEDAARQARQCAMDAMELARNAGAEEHAARRFALTQELLQDAAAPMAARMYAKAIADYDAAARTFRSLANRVEVVKAEKAELQSVLESLRAVKAERRTIVAGTKDAAAYSEARELETRARHAETRIEAIDLLKQALAKYRGDSAGRAIPQVTPGAETAIMPPAVERERPASATRSAPAKQIPSPAHAEKPVAEMPRDIVAQSPGDVAARMPEEPTITPADVTMPARGPRVTHAHVPPAPRASQGAVAPPVAHEPQVLLVPDEYPTIQAAIDAAHAGATVRIRPGLYDENLVLKNGVKVIGEDRKTVIVRAPIGQTSVVFAKNCRTGLLAGMTLEHGTSRGGDPRYAGIKLHNSSPGIFRCIVQRTAGSGVIVKAGGKPTIRECVIQDNPGPGIYVRGKGTSPQIKGNICARNTGRGIYFDSGSSGLAIENECRENQGSGIAVHDDGTAPELRQNTCSQNSEYGLYFGRGAAGVAEENTCSHNSITGISVHDASTSPSLRRNTCAENKNDGIYFGDACAGVAQGNTCTRNGEDGIFVRDPATSPRLMQNHCLGNMLRGIEFGFGAHGFAEGNRCEQNAREGIRVSNVGTTAELRANECIDNGTRGIYFSKGAGGTADANVCEGNKECGIGVANAGTAPLLRKNRLQRNVQYGLVIDRDASPVLEHNQWAHNGVADLNDERPV